ncbi:MAG: hypothetical protein LBI57_01305 [Helicobacteraceae bacterium]|jgi:hypothetical protein|nr:hypothetical protein [Helicobacteraceae bacterium]
MTATDNVYADLLVSFGASLEQTSKDKSGSMFITDHKTKVVDFDKFKDDVCNTIKPTEQPCSCDALYMSPTTNELFLIEFKNGKIDSGVKKQLRFKILDSLLMLLEKLDKIIEFTRDHLSFILVYGETSNKEQVRISSFRLGKMEINFGIDRFERIYFKKVFAYSNAEFDEEFSKLYA